MTPHQRLQKIVGELRQLEVGLDELRAEIVQKDEKIAAMTQRLVDNDGGHEDELEAAQTRRVSREDMLLAKARAQLGSDDPGTMAEKIDQSERDLKRLENLLNTRTIEAKRVGEQLSAVIGQVEQIGRGAKQRDLIATAVRYYVTTPLLMRFTDMLAGTTELDPKIQVSDGRTLGQSGALDETSSPLGAFVGSKAISIRDRRLVLEERYRTVFASWMRSAIEQQVASQLDVLSRGIAQGLVESIKAAANLPK